MLAPPAQKATRAAYMRRIDKSMTFALNVLVNKDAVVGDKVHARFVKEQGENVAFLLSRITVLISETQHISKAALDYLEKNMHLVDAISPAFWLTRCELETKCDKTLTKIGYPSLFPKAVLDESFTIATDTFVWQGLAVWFHHNKDETKLAEVVNVGIKRMLKHEELDLQFLKSKKLLVRSAQWFYFFSHVVLIATMWGELKRPIGGSKVIWQKITSLLVKWGNALKPYARENLEIWIESLLCLDLLAQHEEVDKLHKDSLFDIAVPFQTQWQFYHTYALWGLFFAMRIKILSSEQQKIVVQAAAALPLPVVSQEDDFEEC